MQVARNMAIYTRKFGIETLTDTSKLAAHDVFVPL